jgi:FtsP/CotA-like multicopper oxidase with cupredoxin domain
MQFRSGNHRPSPTFRISVPAESRSFGWVCARLLAICAVAAVVLSGCSLGTSADIETPEFTRELRVPEVQAGQLNKSGTRVYDLEVDQRQHDFGQGGPSDTIGISSDYLGPTLRMTRGEKVRVNVANGLDEMTTLHWHGMHVPAQMDGGPHQMVAPGTTWSPAWDIDQPAATLWYHSHPHGQTAQQVYRGAAGMLLIDDPAQDDFGMPHDYGVDDFPVIVQDKSFTPDGQMIVDPEGTASTGFLGDTVIVNGTVGPYLDVTTEAVRLRLLNASNARVYDFGFDDDRDFQVVASDGGLLAEPLVTNRIQLSPAERAEVVVRVEPGELVRLTSYPPDLGVGAQHRFGSGEFGVLELRSAPTLTPAPLVAASLDSDRPRLDESDAARTRRFKITGLAINGQPMAMGMINETVTVDDVEIWEISNRDPQPHNLHVHDNQFQILTVNGELPGPELSGFKDTVYVPPRQSVRILLQFTDYTDPQWPYMYHCHLLWHEDLGIMGQFVVVKPGEEADPSNLTMN